MGTIVVTCPAGTVEVPAVTVSSSSWSVALVCDGSNQPGTYAVTGAMGSAPVIDSSIAAQAFGAGFTTVGGVFVILFVIRHLLSMISPP